MGMGCGNDMWGWGAGVTCEGGVRRVTCGVGGGSDMWGWARRVTCGDGVRE